MDVRKVDVQAPSTSVLFPQSIHEAGFAILTDHSVSQHLLQEFYQERGTFFKSPEKHRYTFDPKIQDDYFPFKSENAKGYPAKDLKKFLLPLHNQPCDQSYGDAARVSRHSAPLFIHPRGNVKLSDQHTACSYLCERLTELSLLIEEDRIAQFERDGLFDAA